VGKTVCGQVHAKCHVCHMVSRHKTRVTWYEGKWTLSTRRVRVSAHALALRG
jgi:hypothetical protein